MRVTSGQAPAPRPVRDIENEWVPLSDGCRLAARIWLPADAETDPVPAVLEYVPYRKDDDTAAQDARRHPYFAARGYASVRVDMRGSGDSDGVLLDEYLAREQDDALEVLAWLEAQTWCTGAVGMIGYSWGGFNGLQVAARRPRQLRAVITLCSTDDRYADDCHYMGGCLLGSDQLKWASTMRAFQARPPDPRFAGEGWREQWLGRLEDTPPYIEEWLTHQRRDSYWRHGSVREDYGAIVCPVFVVGGWADPYTNAVPRLLEGLSVPRLGLIGPWSHGFPQEVAPGPNVGFLQECVRWWDHWLKGIENGVMDAPMLRAWVQESVPPAAFYNERPGRWVAEAAWPPADGCARVWTLEGDGALCGAAGGAAAGAGSAEGAALTILGDQACGRATGVWCANGLPDELPVDQRPDDAVSLTWDSEPLAERIELLGFPDVRLALAVDRPNALIAVRLCDVAPDGGSLLVTWGLLNLTHRDGDAAPSSLGPGRRLGVAVRLNAVGQAVPAGHRLRLSVSPTYWPHAWPSPEPVTLSVFCHRGSSLSLPVRTSRPEDDALPAFGGPEWSEPVGGAIVSAALRARSRTRNDKAGLSGIEDVETFRMRLEESGTDYEHASRDVWSIADGDPLSATLRCERTIALDREGWNVRIETVSSMTADAGAFHVDDSLEAFEGTRRVFVKRTRLDVPRDGV